MTTIALMENSVIKSMDNLTIVPFEKGDIPYLVSIENACFSTPFKEKDFLDILNSEISSVLVAKVDGNVIGFVSFTIIIDELQIINVAVDPLFQGKGIGNAIMNELISYGSKNGVLKYFLEVRESNLSAIHLYEKYGFKQVGISKNHFSLPRENAILMNLEKTV